jgi:hypothetical protein
MKFNKMYLVSWKNFGSLKQLIVIQEKDTNFLYIPKLALATGSWEPFVSLEGDVAIIAEGVGDPIINKEIRIDWRLSKSGEIERYEI